MREYSFSSLLHDASGADTLLAQIGAAVVATHNISAGRAALPVVGFGGRMVRLSQLSAREKESDCIKVSDSL